MVLPHPRGPVNVNVRKARGVSSARSATPCWLGITNVRFACMSNALALGRRTLQPASPLALQLTVCKHVALVPGPLGAPPSFTSAHTACMQCGLT